MLRSIAKQDVLQTVRIPVGVVSLDGDLTVPPGAGGLVIFAHGSGSSRHSPRNRRVAETLNRCGLATLLFDLLTPVEEQSDANSGHLRFDIELLAQRVDGAAAFARRMMQTAALPLGCFGASTGAAAALVAAARRPEFIKAVVSRGGRPDLAGEELRRVQAPTLLIVGGEDPQVLELNQRALSELHCEKKLEIVRGAGHLFEEPGALDEVARLASDWFARVLA